MIGRVRNAPNTAASSGCSLAGRDLGTTNEVSRSTTKPSGTPPRRRRQPTTAGAASARVFPNANTVACAAECGNDATNPNAFR